MPGRSTRDLRRWDDEDEAVPPQRSSHAQVALDDEKAVAGQRGAGRDGERPRRCGRPRTHRLNADDARVGVRRRVEAAVRLGPGNRVRARIEHVARRVEFRDRGAVQLGERGRAGRGEDGRHRGLDREARAGASDLRAERGLHRAHRDRRVEAVRVEARRIEIDRTDGAVGRRARDRGAARDGGRGNGRVDPERAGKVGDGQLVAARRLVRDAVGVADHGQHGRPPAVLEVVVLHDGALAVERHRGRHGERRAEAPRRRVHHVADGGGVRGLGRVAGERRGSPRRDGTRGRHRRGRPPPRLGRTRRGAPPGGA